MEGHNIIFCYSFPEIFIFSDGHPINWPELNRIDHGRSPAMVPGEPDPDALAGCVGQVLGGLHCRGVREEQEGAQGVL